MCKKLLKQLNKSCSLHKDPSFYYFGKIRHTNIFHTKKIQCLGCANRCCISSTDTGLSINYVLHSSSYQWIKIERITCSRHRNLQNIRIPILQIFVYSFQFLSTDKSWNVRHSLWTALMDIRQRLARLNIGFFCV